jgi:gliding motility-associated peptidyl-prolyl isomerase|tara:strand:- start:270 stop:803 length:534 start_codon:yes stop_codon:yes gene_type:complete
MKQSILYLIPLILISSCKLSEARRPISNNSGTFIDASIERNKQLNKFEYNQIETLIKASEKNVLNSDYGFWYYYNNKIETTTKTPKFGDLVYYTYNVKTLSNEEIYSKKELSQQTYYIDQQELFSGLREGLKLMKEGEVVTFIFPSQKAYGYYGDNDQIGSNEPLICEVSLLKHQIN